MKERVEEFIRSQRLWTCDPRKHYQSQRIRVQRVFDRPGNTLACLVWRFGLLIAAPLSCHLRLCCERRLGHIPWLFFTRTCFSDELSKHSKDSYLSIILTCMSSVDIWLQEFVGMGVGPPPHCIRCGLRTRWRWSIAFKEWVCNISCRGLCND